MTQSLFDTPKAKAKEPEVVSSESKALAPRVAPMELAPFEYQQEVGMIERLANLERGQGLQIFEQRAKLIEQCRTAAIRATHPQDWVLTRDRSGTVNGMLCGPGADQVALYYGIEIYNVRPQEKGVFAPLEERDGDEVQFVAWCDAVSNMTGRRIENIEARRASTEGFIGRGAVDGTSKLVARGDLRLATYTLLRTKATRILAGMTRIAEDTLREAWEGTSKSIDQCRKGSGFGTASERNASKVAEEGVPEARDKLRDEILRRVGGDTDAARKLLRDITANHPKFQGFDQIDRLTKIWQIDNAFAKLREHEIHGDAMDGGEK